MFAQKSKKSDPALEKAIDALHHEMNSVTGDSPEYAQMVKQLGKLYKIQEQLAPKKVSADTKALVIGNLVGIAMIVGHERANVVTSKAIGFVSKLR